MSFSLKSKKVYIAGHGGLVGGAVLRRLSKEGCDIVLASHKDLDLTNQALTQDFMLRHRPDIVIIAAAKVGGIGANINAPAEFIRDNIMISTNLIHAAHTAGVERLLFLGSSCMYPVGINQPMKEDDLLKGKPEPTNAPYAIAKLAGAQMVEAYRKQYGARYISAIPCNLYGRGDRFDKDASHVIPAMMLKVRDAVESGASVLELWGTGKPLREFLHVDDLARGIVFLLKNYDGNSPVNIGSGSEVRIDQLAHEIAKIAKYTKRIVFNSQYPDGTYRKVMDCSLINSMGWRPKISLGDGLRDTYEWFVSNIS